MTLPLAALSGHGYWWIALGIGLAAALVVAFLLAVLVMTVVEHRALGRRPARGRDQGRGQHREHPAARGDRARARPDRRGGRRAGRLHERAHRRVRWSMSTATSWRSSRRPRRRRGRRARGRADRRSPAPRADLAGPRDARVRARGRGGRAPAPARGSGHGDQRAVRHHPRRAARHRPQGRGRGRAEAAMTPLVDRRHRPARRGHPGRRSTCCNGVLSAARSIVPSVEKIARAAAAGRRTSTPRRCCSRRRIRSPDGRGSRGVRRLARRDPRRRELGDPCSSHPSHPSERSRSSPPLLIVLALVYYLVATILELRKITAGLDEVIVSVGEIVEKSAPVNDVVNHINGQLDAGVDLLEGLLVQKAGMDDAVGLVEGLYAGAAAAGFRNFPESGTIEGAADRRGLHEGHAHARPARPRGSDRDGQPGRPGAAQRRGRQPRGAPLYARSAIRARRALPRSPVIGTDAPVQYEQRDDIGAPRRRLPSRGPRRVSPTNPE